MAEAISFSDRLRIERERNGYDLNDVSKRLHIRPDILVAIESSDFDRMPARGYSKNMIRAYARLLGLDERSITDMYLDEVEAYERGELPRGRQGSSRSSRKEQSQRGRGSSSASDRKGGRASGSSRSNGSSGSRKERSASRGREGSGKGAGVLAGAAGITSLFGGSSKQDGRVPRSFDTIGSTPPYARNVDDGRRLSLDRVNLPILLAIIAAVIIVLIVAVVISNSALQSNDDVPDIPISGLTDTSEGSGDDSSKGAAAEKAPTSVEFEYTVKDGESVWIEVYEGDDETPIVAEMKTGPASETFDVETTLTFKTPNPTAVECTVDGEEVKLEEDSTGLYSCEVDFEKYLEEWNEEHGVSSSKSKSSSSSSKSSSSSRSRSSSSSDSDESANGYDDPSYNEDDGSYYDDGAGGYDDYSYDYDSYSYDETY